MKTIPTMLAEIPELAIEVQATTGIGAPNPGARSDRHIRTVPGSRPPLDLHTVDLLRTDPLDGLTIGKGAATSHLVDRLGLCVRMVAEERANASLSAPEPSYGGFATTCGYLASTAPWWLAEPGLSDDISQEVTAIHKALEIAARVAHEPVYRCDKCGARAHRQPGDQWMICEAGHSMPGLGAIREKIRRSKPMTAAAMEREWGAVLGLRADTIGSWGRKGWITERGRVLVDRKWRPVFDPWDVMQFHQGHADAIPAPDREAAC